MEMERNEILNEIKKEQAKLKSALEYNQNLYETIKQKKENGGLTNKDIGKYTSKINERIRNLIEVRAIYDTYSRKLLGEKDAMLVFAEFNTQADELMRVLKLAKELLK